MHDAPWEHHHEVGDPLAGLEDVVVWKTVGLDVGSATSQIVFSEIALVRDDSRYVVADRKVLRESEVILTPFCSPALIDPERLASFIDREFVLANMTRAEVDTGTVILTGLALATDNARAIADAVADDSGRFVAVSAGDLLEAKLAAYGAGVPALSTDGLLIHIDIGGGTTKFSTWENSKLLNLAAIDVGARLLTFDINRRVASLEVPALRLGNELGLEIRIGQIIPVGELKNLARAMAMKILHFAGLIRDAPRFEWLQRTPPLPRRSQIGAVVFSGGVSEYIYNREQRSFGDLGKLIGSEMRALLRAAKTRIVHSDRGIRATVLGASQHSVQLSGNTVFVSHPKLLPLRNIPVLLPSVSLGAEALDSPRIADMIEHAAQHLDMTARAGPLAVAFRWRGSATYERVRALADALLMALSKFSPADQICIVVVDCDIAGVLGSQLQEACFASRPVICVDSINVSEMDYLDIDTFAPKTRALPVIVKSLLFDSAHRLHDHVRKHGPHEAHSHSQDDQPEAPKHEHAGNLKRNRRI